MREDQKFTLAITESGNLVVPLAYLKNMFGQELQYLIDTHKFYTIGIMSSEENQCYYQ